jgi:DNA helicase-2/ATP-dependent DNA helicase PcrA
MAFCRMSNSSAREDDLDPEQAAAVSSDVKAIAVLAGPGSGKTRVLSFRARRLLGLDHGSRALLLTFTNKAAAEMKARALGVSNVTSDHISASTFHTFGLRVLQSHGDLTPVGREFETLDETEISELTAEVAAEVGLPNYYYQWSYHRLRRQEPSNPGVRRFADAYEAAKRARGVADFDDLISYTAQLLIENAAIAEAFATRWPHVLVDEFQDTNAAQFAIVRALFPAAKSVSVFADDDQAIYRFAGAESENVRRFLTELSAKEFPLTINYRCREAIVSRANRLIAADPSASGRQMRAHHAGGEVRVLQFGDQREESVELADEIAGLASDGVHPWEIAILGRAAFRVTPLMHELNNRGVLINNWLTHTYDTPERRTLKTCLAIMRGAMSERQARHLRELLKLDDGESRDPEEILRPHASRPPVAGLLAARELAWQGIRPSEVVRAVEGAIRQMDPELADRIAIIAEDTASFEIADPDFTLDHLLAELTLGSVGGPPTAGGGVKVATLHRTKGLQWPHVYILGLEDGRMPDYRATSSGNIAEERRTCFVGVCRAEHVLTLTHTRSYSGRRLAPSPFLAEMGLV